MIFHGVASAIILGFVFLGWLNLFTASAFGVALAKFLLILWQKNWYCKTKIQQVALLEAFSSFAFLIVVTLSVLPPYLPG